MSRTGARSIQQATNSATVAETALKTARWRIKEQFMAGDDLGDGYGYQERRGKGWKERERERDDMPDEEPVRRRCLDCRGFVSKAEETTAALIRVIRTELVATYVDRIGHPDVAARIRQHFGELDDKAQEARK
jgi:hypothetical protein